MKQGEAGGRSLQSSRRGMMASWSGPGLEEVVKPGQSSDKVLKERFTDGLNVHLAAATCSK